ncbi:MAG: DNRLRE domain-containing protein [Actinomycetota bacterium]|nr:DNRLRE domain-containing protein [Actinomycetota bacterium]
MKDAGVLQANQNTNTGSATSVSVSSSLNANQRIYISFDLTKCSPAVASTATIGLATLRIYVTAVPPTCRTIDLFKNTTAWSEGTIKWSNQPFGTTLNNPASNTASGTLAIGAVSCANTAANQYYSFTVTSDVGTFVSGGSTNGGWMLRDDAESNSVVQTMTMSTKDLGTLAQAPQLIVVYS